MKKRVLQVLCGICCFVAAFPAGQFAVVLLWYVVIPTLQFGPNTITVNNVTIGNIRIEGNQVYVVTGLAAVLCISLLLSGLFLVLPRPEKSE